MAKVQKTVITALGEQMLFSSALTYTNATLCSQDISNLTIDQLRSLTDLTGKVLSSPISAHKRQGNTKADQVDVQVTFTNQDQKADINYSSIGWFARDRQGHETLIAVTPFVGTDTIAAAPPDGAATSSKNITLSMAAGTATEINVLIDPAGSVTPSTFNAEVDKINEALALKADNAELADYAKKADVNSALDAKADKTALDSLAKSEDVAKDVETLNSAINLKADKTDLAPLAKTEDVNTELDKKADKTALDDYAKSSDVAADVKQLSDSIATKADAKTVDDAIGKIDFTPYAKTADVQAGLDTKADKTALDAYAKSADVANDVKTLQDNINAKADAQTVSDAVSKIDLTPFAKTADVNSALSGKADKVTIDAINKALASKRDITDSYSRDELDKKFLQLSADTGGKVSADQVSKLIAGKADQDDVDAKIKTVIDLANTKADKTDVTAQFATKADKTTVESDLATKADQSSLDETNAEVAKKADSEDVTKQLATKANVSDVDDALSKKDNTADVDAKIKTVTDLANTKANASDVYTKSAVDTAFGQRDTKIGNNTNVINTINEALKSLIPDDTHAPALPAGFDLNNYFVGWRRSVNTTLKNMPFGWLNNTMYFQGTVAGSDGRFELALYIGDGSNTNPKIAYRFYGWGNWKPWVLLADNGDISNLQNQITNATNLANQAINTKANSSDVYVRKDVDNAFSEVRDRIGKLEGSQTVDNPDFNNLTDTGVYYVSDSKYKGMTNGPTGTWGNLVVSNGNGHRISQLYFPDDGSAPFMRELDESTWHNWIQLSTKQDVNSATNLANAASNKVDTVLANSYVRKQGMNANGDCVEIKHTGIKQANGGYAFDMWSDDWTASKLQDVIKNQLPSKANTADVNNALNDKANAGDVNSLNQTISALQQTVQSLQNTVNQQATQITGLQTQVNNQANQLTYFKQHYIESKAFDADQIKQAMAWTGDDGQKLAIIRDKENEGGK